MSWYRGPSGSAQDLIALQKEASAEASPAAEVSKLRRVLTSHTKRRKKESRSPRRGILPNFGAQRASLSRQFRTAELRTWKILLTRKCNYKQEVVEIILRREEWTIN